MGEGNIEERELWHCRVSHHLACPHLCQSVWESVLLLLSIQFLADVPGKQQRMSQVLEFLIPIWETWLVFLAELACPSPCCCSCVGSKAVTRGWVSLFLLPSSVSFSHPLPTSLPAPSLPYFLSQLLCPSNERRKNTSVFMCFRVSFLLEWCCHWRGLFSWMLISCLSMVI